MTTSPHHTAKGKQHDANRYGYPPDLQEELVKAVLAQAELLCAEWV